jgi:predicted proteasome-type protease
VPITIEKLPGEPIIVVTCSGHLDRQAMTDMFAQTMTLMQDAKAIYRIVDYHAVTTPFGDVLRAVQEATANHPHGSTTDPHIKPVMVGGEGWLSQAREAFAKQPFGAVQIPMFNDMAEAVMAVRQQISEKE